MILWSFIVVVKFYKNQEKIIAQCSFIVEVLFLHSVVVFERIALWWTIIDKQRSLRSSL